MEVEHVMNRMFTVKTDIHRQLFCSDMANGNDAIEL